MSKIILVLLYIFITILNALESNFSLLENKAPRRGRNYEYLDDEELQYVVSIGVFKNGNYKHICIAVMITELNGITAGTCGHYEYYAHRAELIQDEKNLTKEERTKLHVNTKRPMHSNPDMFYTVIRFIDFKEYHFDECEEQIYQDLPDIGIIVLKKKVQFTRPVLNIPIARIKDLPDGTYFTLIGMNTMEERPLEEKMFMKETIRKFDFFHILTDILSLKPSQFPVQSIYYNYGFFPEDDLGAPVYWENQYVGILVQNRHAIVSIDAVLEKHINKIIASTWISHMKERKLKRRHEVSTSSATII